MLAFINSFGAKFQTTFVVCVFFFFFFLINYRLERSLYVKLKNWNSNSADPDETAHISYESTLFAKTYIIYGSERVKLYEISWLKWKYNRH